jgi:hypothetical protein
MFFTTSNAFETERQNSLTMKTSSRHCKIKRNDLSQRERITTQESVIRKIRRSGMVID